MQEPHNQKMSDDERGVRERLRVVRDLLQAQKARRGVHQGDPFSPARSAVASFLERVHVEGWTLAFDEMLAELRDAASLHATDPDAPEITAAAAYLAEAAPLVTRLARAARWESSREDPKGPLFLKASEGVPALHPPTGSVSSETSTERDFVEPGALAQLSALSRDVLDEVASLALLRVTDGDEPWTLGALFEERLLQMLDAALALARGPIRIDIHRAARARAEESPLVEPYKWFVPLFLLSCTAGERAMDALRQTLCEAPPGALRGLVDALCLGSNPARVAIAASLLDEDDRPDLLCVALDVLVRLRQPLPAITLELLEHPDEQVALRAAAAAPLVEDPEAAARALDPLLERDDIGLHAASALTLIAPEIGAGHLRDAVQRGMRNPSSDEDLHVAARAALFLAELGQPRDEELLLTLAHRSDAALEALATHGSPASIDYLRAELLREPTSPTRTEGCVRSLERLTGILEGDDPSPGGGELERAKWMELVLSFAAPPDARRVRLGKPFHPSLLAHELGRPDTRSRTRQSLARELRLLSVPLTDIDLEGWIAPQQAWIARVLQGDRPFTAGATRRERP